jgi:regulator of sirC expression with transglutaminase-like and TPR domain
MTDNDNTKALKALVQLLDEPDEQVYTTIHDEILDCGSHAVPFLEDSLYHSENELIRERAESLIRHIQNRRAFLKLKDWAEHRSTDLLEAYCLVSNLYQDEEASKANQKSVEKIYRDIWLEMNDELTALEKTRVVNHFFFDVYHFSGHQAKPNLPAYLLGNLLRMQSGNHLSLSVLYLIITQKLGLPVFGVNLPRHFILAYMDDTRATRQAKNYTQKEVLFYINPFDKGAIFRKSEIELFIQQQNIKPQENFFLPCNNLTVIRRLLAEIRLIHQKKGQKNQEETINHLLLALDERWK